MTCIYDAWSEALRIGHDQIQLKKEPILQQTMFDEYVHVDGDNVKAEKVIRSVRRDISDEAYLDVYYATLSAEEDALQAIYNFLRVGFAVGSKVLEQYSNPHVMRMLELRRKVGNESHHFNECYCFCIRGVVFTVFGYVDDTTARWHSYAEVAVTPIIFKYVSCCTRRDLVTDAA